jgi:lysyl-tRNA synthetase class 1
MSLILAPAEFGLTCLSAISTVRRPAAGGPLSRTTLMPASADPTTLSDPSLLAAAGRSRAWPFEEARKVVERVEKRGDPERGVIFETGYGPSGLPHIGTFGEVARTTMVRHAFRVLTNDRIPSRLICFSDDMDGMRKVPDNVPNQALLRANLGKPLTKVPNPFGDGEPSFGQHNNAMLRRFPDTFGFDYEFMSATDVYAAGTLDEKLLAMLAHYDEVMAIMLPTLREERRQTYAPFLPVHPGTGVVMQVPIEERNLAAGTIIWTDPETGERFETPVTGGHAKAQWKPDWALRWAALGVDYEMSGKDHIDNVKTSSKICRTWFSTYIRRRGCNSCIRQFNKLSCYFIIRHSNSNRVQISASYIWHYIFFL